VAAIIKSPNRSTFPFVASWPSTSQPVRLVNGCTGIRLKNSSTDRHPTFGHSLNLVSAAAFETPLGPTRSQQAPHAFPEPGPDPGHRCNCSIPSGPPGAYRLARCANPECRRLHLHKRLRKKEIKRGTVCACCTGGAKGEASLRRESVNPVSVNMREAPSAGIHNSRRTCSRKRV
jgi:hypothetical protein